MIVLKQIPATANVNQNLGGFEWTKKEFSVSGFHFQTFSLHSHTSPPLLLMTFVWIAHLTSFHVALYILMFEVCCIKLRICLSSVMVQ
ncbi:hypothetical protein ACS0TY_012037 [Phlomoides rotata]